MKCALFTPTPNESQYSTSLQSLYYDSTRSENRMKNIKELVKKLNFRFFLFCHFKILFKKQNILLFMFFTLLIRNLLLWLARGYITFQTFLGKVKLNLNNSCVSPRYLNL